MDGAAKESGLRENCTSRLIERTEGGLECPTSSDSTPVMPGNAGGGKDPYFWRAFEGNEMR
jgi:hypothetical protein